MATFDLQQWSEHLDRAARTKLPGELRKAMIGAALTAEAHAKRLVTNGGRDRLNVRSGRLRSSIRARVEGNGLDTQVVLRAEAPYARVHERGGVIRPTRARMLAIPLSGAKTAGGDARGGPRDWPDLFMLRSKAGNLLLVRRDGDEIVPMFVLKDSVRIPARPYLRPGVLEARRKLPDLLEKAVRRAVAIDG